MSDLHMGRLGPGDRLPSIRQVARERGADHRAVARAYRELAEEGLVEIQGRSGVRVTGAAGSVGGGGGDAGERTRWLAGVIAESWSRRVTTGDLGRLLEACAGGARLRCACVESNRDQMLAYCAEIGQHSGMTMVPCYVAADPSRAGEAARLREELRAADVVVTTQYHAAVAREALERGGPPLVVLRINPDLAEAVRARLRGPGITVVAATAEFGERLRLMYADSIPSRDRLRVVLAGDEAAVRRLDPEEPVLLTRAARELLPELSSPKLVFPHSPTIARDSVRELTEIIVGLSVAESPVVSTPGSGRSLPAPPAR